ncbi:glycosyltransferase [Novosphingobium sp.]|uniref:glycosyltransferase n=1 Tax=Novosphingobium sp. TaxID=1874826 RepID=UPI0038B7CA50
MRPDPLGSGARRTEATLTGQAIGDKAEVATADAETPSGRKLVAVAPAAQAVSAQGSQGSEPVGLNRVSLTGPQRDSGRDWRALRTIAGLALRGDPRLALGGMWDMLRGRRVRGLNRLNAAAKACPDWYDGWIARAEPALLADWSQPVPQGVDGRPRTAPKVACLVVDDDRAGRSASVTSFIDAFPDGVIFSRQSGAPADLEGVVRLAHQAGCSHLLALRAGDRVERAFGDILANAFAAEGVAASPLLYWDSDSLAAGRRTDPVIKPDWDSLLLEELDLLGSAALARIDAAQAVLASPTLAGAQADGGGVVALQLALVQRLGALTPVHLPLILTHRAEGRQLVDERVRQQLLTDFGLRCPATPDSPWPSVSVIVPTRDQAGILQACLDGISRLDYPAEVEVLVLDNDSVEPETHALFAELVRDGRARVVPCPGEFNFAALTNLGVHMARGRLVCLLNNDVEPLDGSWLRSMVREAVAPGIGAVGARLLYPDGTIQHVGIAIGLGGSAGHVQKGVHPDEPELANWHAARRRVSAVTAACLVVERDKYLAAGGMDEESFSVDFNDVDLCLRLQQVGLINLVVPAATLIHHESKTRGIARNATQQARFDRETATLRARWGTVGYRDPWFSPLFRWQSEQCQMAF